MQLYSLFIGISIEKKKQKCNQNNKLNAKNVAFMWHFIDELAAPMVFGTRFFTHIAIIRIIIIMIANEAVRIGRISLV